MHECYNPLNGKIVKVESDGFSGFAVIESNLSGKKRFVFTFDKIVDYKGEYPTELKRFGPEGLTSGVWIIFTLDVDRKVFCVHPSVKQGRRIKMAPPRDSKGRVFCKCGAIPELDKNYNLEGPENSVHYRLKCPKCGAKNAPWRRSQLMAAGDWENGYYNR